MENEPPQVQAVRPVNKDSLDSVADSRPTSKIMYFDCNVDPTTKKGFILWDDIRLAFSDALYVCHQAKVVPFMKGIDFMPLQPLRIPATPNVVLDIVVDGPLVHTEAAVSQGSSQTPVQDKEMKASVQRKAKVQKEVSDNATTTAIITKVKTATAGRNPEYGLVEAAMQNYNHIDNPAFSPKPRAPQYILRSDDNHSNGDESTDSLALTQEQPSGNGPLIDIEAPLAPHYHTAAAAFKDISPIVVKATLGDANSQVQLGEMHKIGDNVEQDYEAARYWYLKAAKQGNASAQCSVGDLYRLGLGVDFNHSTALSWYQKAADQGDASGQYSLGFMYQYGLAVEMDYAVAMDWYRKSAEQGYAFAQSRIGDLYYDGHSVTKDYSKAMEWYLIAANQDLSRYPGSSALHCKDYSIAKEWYTKAARQELPEAREALEELQRIKDSEEEDEKAK
ncbi:hypothetical protein BGZ95_003762 [Linnemannia exigua]|uniref:HCP-like protein n=1 Tax=Linnemannia exigua TaxID=604196 RepID=A0AAD4DHS3_9FUNG|nr:hypothetical protein BGZ95_003762 [Linnemannia exigua]